MRQLSRLSMDPSARSAALATDAVASIAADYEAACPVVYRELIDPALERDGSEPLEGQGDVTGILVAALCEIQAKLPEGSATPANDPSEAQPDSARGPITERSTPWPLETGTLVEPGAAWPRAPSWQDVAWEHQASMRALPPGDRGAPTQRVPRRRAVGATQLLVLALVMVALLGLGAFAWLKLLAEA